MTASQLAAELEVSQRTVLRDIEALGSAGVPVYPVRGKLGGFELIEGFTSDLPSSRLHHHPATAPAARGIRATIWLSPRGRRLAMLLGRPAGVRIRRSASSAAHRDGWVQAWIPVESAEETVTDMLALGAEAELVDPPELRARIREAALRIARLHGHGELQRSCQFRHDPIEPAELTRYVLERPGGACSPFRRRRDVPDSLGVGQLAAHEFRQDHGGIGKLIRGEELGQAPGHVPWLVEAGLDQLLGRSERHEHPGRGGQIGQRASWSRAVPVDEPHRQAIAVDGVPRTQVAVADQLSGRRPVRVESVPGADR